MAKDLRDRLLGTYSMGPFGKRDFSKFIPPIQKEAAAEIDRLTTERDDALSKVENLRGKLAQMYQIVGVCWSEDIPNIQENEFERVLDYLSDLDKYDENFLPWPK